MIALRVAILLASYALLTTRPCMLPDRRGNNRIDTLKNIVRDPRVSLLFLVPGVGETLRINGRAEISTDPELCASFEMQGKAPRSVIVVTADRVYFQCQKALAQISALVPGCTGATRRIANCRSDSIGRPCAGRRWMAMNMTATIPERLKQTIY